MIENKEAWDDMVKKNDDPYGKACMDVARESMRMLDEDEAYKTEINCHKMLCAADKTVKAGGITGFMAGCVAGMIGQVHSRGNEFRLAWNKEHGVEEEKAKGGTVNPAIMTIET